MIGKGKAYAVMFRFAISPSILTRVFLTQQQHCPSGIAMYGADCATHLQSTAERGTDHTD
jgi:hypothetical protein